MKKFILVVMSLVLLFPVSALAASSKNLLDYVTVDVEYTDLYVGETVQMSINPTVSNLPDMTIVSSDESVLQVEGDLSDLSVTAVSVGTADLILSSTSEYEAARIGIIGS
jgi:hypothetical protein